MLESTKSNQLFCILSGISGIAGVVMLMISFTINTGPPLGAPGSEFTKYVQQSYASVLWGAWLQAVGPVFIVLFAFALVHLSRATSCLAGWMTFFGALSTYPNLAGLRYVAWQCAGDLVAGRGRDAHHPQPKTLRERRDPTTMLFNSGKTPSCAMTDHR
jgi:hypothetical protein